jgi:transcription elongation factor Elf1
MLQMVKRERFHMASVSIPHREKCPRCGSESVHLEWHERVNAQEVQDLWGCWNCKSEFITVVPSDEREPSVTEITEPFFTSLVV